MEIVLKLIRFDLRKSEEWAEFYDLFTAYLAEVCDEEEYRENIADLHDDALNQQLIQQTQDANRPYLIQRIVRNGECVGMISCAFDSQSRRGFINNFYVRPEHRKQGIGVSAYAAMEAQLRELGAAHVELMPVETAVGFYERMGFASSGITAEGERVYGKEIRAE